MHLREAENIQKIYHHHPTPFVFKLFKILLGAFPFLLMLFIFKNTMSTKWYVIAHVIVFAVFALVVTYFSLVYWLDKLVVTNQRLVYINWKYITVRNESEAFLDDIQDIQSHENGVFSYFWVFDYGYILIETASSHVSIAFEDAPNPEEIRQYIYHIRPQ